MNVYFELPWNVQMLVYAMTQAARNAENAEDRTFAARMVDASYEPGWRPSAAEVQRMTDLDRRASA